MATNENKTSRRQVLGAMVAIPATAIAAPSAVAAFTTPDRSAWDAAFAKMEQAKAASEGTYDDVLCNAFCEAQSVVLETPAPDLAALRWKMETLFGEGEARDPDGYCASWCPAWMNALMADTRRLLRN